MPILAISKFIYPVQQHLMAAASIHFLDWGGGGQKLEKCTQKIGAQSRNIKLKIVYVQWHFYVKFNGFVVRDSAF